MPYTVPLRRFKDLIRSSSPSVSQRKAGTPHLDATFSYRPLRDDEIRLVRILPSSKPNDVHCAMETHVNYFQGNIKYTALSYCWGDVTQTTPITLDGCIVDVTTNLKEALGAIVEHHIVLGSSYYWIDALCINQANGDERNHQVHQMWRIFSSAHEVFSWLGPEDEHLKPALRVVSMASKSCRYPGTHCSGWKKHHLLADGDLMGHFRQVMQRQYFSRTWVIQEFVQARRLWLLCGRHQIDGFDLYHFQKSLSGTQAGDLINHRWHHGPDRRSDPVPHDVLQAVSWLVTTLSSYGRSSCSDTRDRIYALLGDPTIRALDPSEGLKPDYTLQMKKVVITFIEHCDKIIEWFTEDDEDVESEYMKAYVTRLLASLAKAANFENKDSFTRSVKQTFASHGYYKGATSVTIQAGIEISLTGHIMRHLTEAFTATSLASNVNLTPGTVLRTVHSFIARSADELSLAKGDMIELIERDDDFGDGWFLGRHMSNGRTGLFPEVYTLPSANDLSAKESAVKAKEELEVEPLTQPAMDLLNQELDDFRTAWEASMAPAPLQPRDQTSTNEESDPDHLGTKYRALIGGKDEASAGDQPNSDDSSDLEHDAVQRKYSKVPTQKSVPPLPGGRVARMSAFEDGSED